MVGVRHFVRRMVLGSLGSPYHFLRDCGPARPLDHRVIAVVEPGDIPDKKLPAGQQKLQLLAVCTEKAFQDDVSSRQHYLCFLEEYKGQYL